MIVRVEFGLRGPGQNQDSGRKPDGPSAQGVATHIDGSNAVDGRLWWRVHLGTLVVVSWTLSWVCECVGEVVTRRPPATSRVPHRRHTRSPSPCPDRSRPSHSKSRPASGVTAGVCCLPPHPHPWTQYNFSPSITDTLLFSCWCPQRSTSQKNRGHNNLQLCSLFAASIPSPKSFLLPNLLLASNLSAFAQRLPASSALCFV